MRSVLTLAIIVSSVSSALVTLAIVVATGPLAAKAQDSPSVVNARGFALVDANGRVRGQLGFNETGEAGLLLFDPEGVERLRVYLDAAGNPGVGLLDPDLTRRVALAVNPQAGAVVLLRDPGIGFEGGQPFRIRLAVRNDGAAHVGLFDPPGSTTRWCESSVECR